MLVLVKSQSESVFFNWVIFVHRAEPDLRWPWIKISIYSNILSRVVKIHFVKFLLTFFCSPLQNASLTLSQPNRQILLLRTSLCDRTKRSVFFYFCNAFSFFCCCYYQLSFTWNYSKLIAVLLLYSTVYNKIHQFSVVKINSKIILSVVTE